MTEIVEFYTASLPDSPHREARLLEEIAYLEARTVELTRMADCAYEKALARSYSALLAARRTQLDHLKKA